MSFSNEPKKSGHRFERKRETNPLIFNLLLPVVILLLSLLVVLTLFLRWRDAGLEEGTGESTTLSATDILQNEPETTAPGNEPRVPPATTEVTLPPHPTESPATTLPEEPEPTTIPTEPGTDPDGTGDLTVEKFTAYSGKFLEDGSGDRVNNVLAALVTNDSGKFLDFATLTYEVQGKTATFVVTGLPAGRSAWVMEIGRMTFSGSAEYKLANCVTTYRDSVIAESSRVNMSARGNLLTAANTSEETLEDVFVYYRCVHEDGNYLGGVSYRVDFGTLAPGETMEVQASHYNETAQIVRIGWKGQ